MTLFRVRSRPCFRRTSVRRVLILAGLAAITGWPAVHAVAAPDQTGPPSASASEREVPQRAKVDLNEADLEQLQKLPRVGPVVAKRIIEYRSAVAKFKSVDELRNVRGIGAKTLESLRPLITVSSQQPEGGSQPSGDDR